MKTGDEIGYFVLIVSVEIWDFTLRYFFDVRIGNLLYDLWLKKKKKSESFRKFEMENRSIDFIFSISSDWKLILVTNFSILENSI